MNTAVWLFPLYMLAINVFVLPIAFGGLLVFSQGGLDADSFVCTNGLLHPAVLAALA